MSNTEHIGIAIFAVVLLIATAQMAFAFGRQIGTRSERQLADRRINGLLAEENARKPSTRKRKTLTYRKVDPRSVGKKRYLNSRLVGTVISTGEVRV
jgi:hypothetical protein